MNAEANASSSESVRAGDVGGVVRLDLPSAAHGPNCAVASHLSAQRCCATRVTDEMAVLIDDIMRDFDDERVRAVIEHVVTLKGEEKAKYLREARAALSRAEAASVPEPAPAPKPAPRRPAPKRRAPTAAPPPAKSRKKPSSKKKRR